jgi:hypothetical protein
VIKVRGIVRLEGKIGGTKTIRFPISEGTFRPQRLLVSGEGSKRVAVTSLRFGDLECLANDSPLTCALFQPDGVDVHMAYLDMAYPPVAPGKTIAITFYNLEPIARVVRVSIEGKLEKSEF